jgi:hypothetical protein
VLAGLVQGRPSGDQQGLAVRRETQDRRLEIDQQQRRAARLDG